MSWRGGSWSPTLTAMASPYRVRRTSSSFTNDTSIYLRVKCFLAFSKPSSASQLVFFQTPHVRRGTRRLKGWIITLYQFTCLKRTFWIIGSLLYAGVALEEFPLRVSLSLFSLSTFSAAASLPFCLFCQCPPASRFIEYGRYRGHYYGTSLDAVSRVMAEGKVCLLDVHPSVSITLVLKKRELPVHSCLHSQLNWADFGQEWGLWPKIIHTADSETIGCSEMKIYSFSSHDLLMF